MFDSQALLLRAVQGALSISCTSKKVNGGKIQLFSTSMWKCGNYLIYLFPHAGAVIWSPRLRGSLCPQPQADIKKRRFCSPCRGIEKRRFCVIFRFIRSQSGISQAIPLTGGSPPRPGAGRKPPCTRPPYRPPAAAGQSGRYFPTAPHSSPRWSPGHIINLPPI